MALPPPLRWIAFLTGAAALVYQVAWARMLARPLGSSAASAALVLGMFLGGISLGAAAAAVSPVLRRRPRRVFGLAEGAAALWAAGLPVMLSGLEPLLARLHGDPWLLALRAALVALLLLPPTACWGASFPALALLATRRESAAPGRSAGGVYAANTLGAGAGALAASYGLLPALGLGKSTALAASAALLVALWALLGRERTGGSAEVRHPGRAAAMRNPRRVPLLGILLLSGAVTLVLELLWIRILGTLFGGSAYVLGTVVALFVLGLGAGAGLAAALPSWTGRIRGAERLVPVALLAAAAATAAAHWSVPGVPRIVAWAFEQSGGSAGRLLGLEAILASVLILPAALALGPVFPGVLRLVTETREQAGRRAAQASVASALGSIAGAVGFVWMLPHLGLDAGLRAVVAAAALAGALALFAVGRGRAVQGSLVVAAATVLILVAPDWPASRIAAGAWLYGEPRLGGRILLHRDGRQATVTVARRGPWLELRINGKVDASTRADLETQVLLGHLGPLLHPDPERALLVGLGSGITAASLLAHGEIGALEIVEIEPAVVEASRRFQAWNRSALADPRVDLRIEDARAYTARRSEAYDLIVSEPSNPWIAGMSDLFTREAFASGRQALRPGGVYLQWVQAYRLAPEDLRGVVRTFRGVFPDASLWAVDRTFGDLVLVGGAPRLQAAGLKRILAEGDAAAGDLRRSGVASLVDLAARRLVIGDDLAALAGDGPALTDDHPWLEYTAPWSLLDEGRFAQVAALLHRHLSPLRSAEIERMGEDPARRRRADRELLALLASSRSLGAEAYRNRLEEILTLDPGNPTAARLLARSWNDRALMLLEAGERAGGHRALERAVRIDASFPPPHLTLGLLAEEAGDPIQAARRYESYLEVYPHDPAAWDRLSHVREITGQEGGAAAAAARAGALRAIEAGR